jgi:hypothetical protein
MRHATDGMVPPGRCMGSGNAPWEEDVGRELEIQAKEKYSGPGRPIALVRFFSPRGGGGCQRGRPSDDNKEMGMQQC